MGRYCYLQFTDCHNNHNKYYIIMENDDYSIDVTYGRVGGSEQHHHYDPYEKDFDSLKWSKEDKGYIDVTHLHESTVEVKTETTEYKPIKNEAINNMIQEIRDASVQFMKKYYTVKAQDVTQKMIDEAYVVIQQLKDNTTNTYRFNRQLEDLFNKVPRKMNKVSEYIAKDEKDFDKIIEREEELLDSLEKIVQSQKSDVKNNQKAKSNQTILEANDLVIRPVTFEEEDYILQKLKEKTTQGRSNEDNYIRAYRVDNKQTEKAFKAFCKDNKLKTHKGTHFYFHGTKFENLWSIFKTGLTVNPKAATTGKAFGNGIYFAEQSEKSLGYTNIAGKSKWGVSGNRNTSYLLMYEVATGKSEIAHNCHRYTLKEITAKGCQSVYAPDRGHGGCFYNSEIMVYKDDQCTIRYMIEIDSYTHKYTISYTDRMKIRLKKEDITVKKGRGTVNFIFKNPLDAGEMKVTYKKSTGLISKITVDDSENKSLSNWDKKWLLSIIERAYVNSPDDWDNEVEKF